MYGKKVFRRHNIKIKYYVSKLIKKIQIPSIINSEIHKSSKVASKSNIKDIKIDKYSYVGNSCTIINTDVGKFCSIADNCIIGGANHPLEWASTSPVFHEGRNILKTNFSHHPFKTSKRTIIENDVWIGNNCLIKSGVRIESGAVIGMGSIVTKDVGAYEVWAGNPAKLIKRRFPEHISEKLLEIEWWNFDDKMIKSKAKYINNIEIFMKKTGDLD